MIRNSFIFTFRVKFVEQKSGQFSTLNYLKVPKYFLFSSFSLNDLAFYWKKKNKKKQKEKKRNNWKRSSSPYQHIPSPCIFQSILPSSFVLFFGSCIPWCKTDFSNFVLELIHSILFYVNISSITSFSLLLIVISINI